MAPAVPAAGARQAAGPGRKENAVVPPPSHSNSRSVSPVVFRGSESSTDEEEPPKDSPNPFAEPSPRHESALGSEEVSLAAHPGLVEAEIRATLQAGAAALEQRASTAEHRADAAETKAAAMEARALEAEMALQEQGVARSTAELELSRVNLELGKLNRGTSQETEERKILGSALETSQAEAKELRLSLKESGNELKAYQNRVKALELKLSQSLRDVQESHVRKSEASVAPQNLCHDPMDACPRWMRKSSRPPFGKRVATLPSRPKPPSHPSWPHPVDPMRGEGSTQGPDPPPRSDARRRLNSGIKKRRRWLNATKPGPPTPPRSLALRFSKNSSKRLWMARSSTPRAWRAWRRCMRRRPPRSRNGNRP